MPYYEPYPDDEAWFRREQRRAAPPAPIRYVDRRPSRADRGTYYHTRSGAVLLPNGRGSRQRSHSRRRPHSMYETPPPAPEIIINNSNEVYEFRDEESVDEPRYQIITIPQQQQPQQHHHSHSHSRRRHSRHSSPRSSRSSSSCSTDSRLQEKLELVTTRKELEKYEAEKKLARWKEPFEKAQEVERIKKELEKFKAKERQEEQEKRMKEEEALAKFKAKQRQEEEEKKFKEELERAQLKKAKAEKEKKEAEEKTIEEWKAKELAKKAKEKEEKEKEDKKYKEKLEDDMRKTGFSDAEIAAVLKKEKLKGKEDRPVYTKMARRYLSLETLRTNQIDFELDNDPEYVIVKRKVPEWEQDYLWEHTTKIRRERRHQLALPAPEIVVYKEKYEAPKETLEFVRKKRTSRKALAYFAGA